MNLNNELKEIMEEVKENHRKLDSCSRHLFNEDLTPERRLNKQWKCSNCGGYINSSEKLWYEKGLCHAKGERDENGNESRI